MHIFDPTPRMDGAGRRTATDDAAQAVQCAAWEVGGAGGKTPRCVTCGYDLVGLSAHGTCPECGQSILVTLAAGARNAMTRELARDLGRALRLRAAVLTAWAFVMPVIMLIESTHSSTLTLTMLGATALSVVTAAAALRVWTLERHAPFMGKALGVGRCVAVLPPVSHVAVILVIAFTPLVPNVVVGAALIALATSVVVHTSLFNALLLTRASCLKPYGSLGVSLGDRATLNFLVLGCISMMMFLSPTFALVLVLVVWGTSVYAVSSVQRQLSRWLGRIGQPESGDPRRMEDPVREIDPWGRHPR